MRGDALRIAPRKLAVKIENQDEARADYEVAIAALTPVSTDDQISAVAAMIVSPIWFSITSGVLRASLCALCGKWLFMTAGIRGFWREAGAG